MISDSLKGWGVTAKATTASSYDGSIPYQREVLPWMQIIPFIWDILNDLFKLADNLDAQGLGKSIPFVSDTDGTRGSMKTDILRFIIREVRREKRLTMYACSISTSAWDIIFLTGLWRWTKKRATI